jgi:hypothetical protein
VKTGTTGAAARIAERKRTRSCRRKRRFRDAAAARSALRRLSVRGRRREVIPLRYYGPCPYCKGFHLTSKELL